MAKTITTNPYGRLKDIRIGEAFVKDASYPEYLDGAQMQFTVYVKVKGDIDARAYFDRREDAELFADALNSHTRNHHG